MHSIFPIRPGLPVPARREMNCRARERGVVLVIALIMLMVVTMLSLSTLQVSVQEEKMAGNTRNRDLAFQAAEAAVQYCLKQVRDDTTWRTTNKKTPAVFGSTALWNVSGNWASGSTTSVSVTMGTGSRLASAPRCIVEEIKLNTDYRVTGRAEGGSSDAVVILQATISLS